MKVRATRPGVLERVPFHARSWALLFALLPALTFAGHWPLRVDIPGTSLYLGVPQSPAAHTHTGTPNTTDDHGSHCHEQAATCSDVPILSGSGLALLSETVAMLGILMVATAVTLAWWQPHRSREISPEPQPPRGALAFAS